MLCAIFMPVGFMLIMIGLTNDLSGHKYSGSNNRRTRRTFALVGDYYYFYLFYFL